MHYTYFIQFIKVQESTIKDLSTDTSHGRLILYNMRESLRF